MLSTPSMFLLPQDCVRSHWLLVEKQFLLVFPSLLCVCVCLTSSREGLPSRDTNRRAITPLNACDVIPPPGSAHQPLPGEMLADGCPLGNVYGTATFSSRLLESRPARHSVTPRCLARLLSFSRLNVQAMVKAKGFSHPKIEMSEGSQSSVGGAQFGTRYRDCMGKTDRPSCATNFQHFIIVYVRMEGYRCCVGTTPRSRRTYVRTNAKDKLRLFATNSAFCGGFEPWTVCYFPHHPTTRPHVTCMLVYISIC